MFVILLFIVLVLVFRVITGSVQNQKDMKHKVESFFCFISYFIMIILAMFRGSDVGADTLSYIGDYHDMSQMSIGDVLYDYKGYEGYYLLSKLFSMIGLPYYIWFGFIELILVSAIARFINKFSTDRLYSIVLFLTTGLFMFSLTGLKQTLAMALILHAYVYIIDKKIALTCLLIIAAYFVHPVSLIGLFTFVIYLIRKTRFVLPVLIVVCLLVCLGGLTTVSLFVSIIGNDHYETYLEVDTSYTMTTLLLYSLIFLCTIPYLFKYYKRGYISKVEVCCVIMIGAFQYLASLSPSLFRLSYPFLPFLFSYVPNTFNVIENKTSERFILKLCALIGPIIFFAYSNLSMEFTFM